MLGVRPEHAVESGQVQALSWYHALFLLIALGATQDGLRNASIRAFAAGRIDKIILFGMLLLSL